ncbi:MAG: response regulator, partial [Ignavibacteria bacterium]|nr:response regulator [Ignavibacteria bacterium]
MSRKKKILVVEDDSTIAQGLKELLQSEDYTVNISANGKDALKKTFVFRPDLILLDINLPTISGFEVCNQVRAKGFRNPIIMLTARKEQIDKLRGLDIGANDYVTKPFDAREVLARVRAQLRSPAPPPPSPQDQRKLLSIMFTDIKDYAKKMNLDEKLALALLKIHNDKISRVVARYGGRVVENIGD